jgi:hypothetical protein
MVFMAPVMLFAALVPIGGLLFVQAEHDTRGFTEVPSPDEAVAEVRRSKLEPDSHAASGTRSSALLHAPVLNSACAPAVGTRVTQGESRAYAYDTVRRTTEMNHQSLRSDIPPYVPPPPGAYLQVKKKAARPITTNLRSDLTGVIRYN